MVFLYSDYHFTQHAEKLTVLGWGNHSPYKGVRTEEY
jgi:hypothetical protein